MARPSPVLAHGPVVLRRWVATDTDDLLRVVTEALPHLRPWMPWAVGAYTIDTARDYLRAVDAGWESESEFAYAVTVDGAVAGSCGLMSRIGPGGLEIGYWLHPAFVGRGIVTAATSALVAAAFELPGIDHVEILHDSANTRSGAVPRRLGFTEVARVTPPREPLTAGEDGVDVRWRRTRAEHQA
ncbi:GNAT family N-acetyltransferase [Actinokineospora sp.]|uniref:GNAT family N-acetyltransferase n=1 Tax=Actinokineospora sp. TaxID=1872133 RepID=UPI0040381800